jgi:lipid-A-disaccharide synthase-like uncharacterized protein
MVQPPRDIEAKTGPDFLARDFSESFAQMRHYDSLELSLVKFACAGYVALIGGAYTIYQSLVHKDADVTRFMGLFLTASLLAGLLLLGYIVRNRVYFVLVARYVNEHRELFLRGSPLGFANRTGMYTDWTKPAFFNPVSTHSFLMYFLAALNAGLLAAAVFFWTGGTLPLWGCVIVWVLGTVLQAAAGAVYLRRKEVKSGADEVAFGDSPGKEE